MDSYKHWRFKSLGSCHSIIWSPTVHDGLVKGFGMCREIFKELKELEKLLKGTGFMYYLIYTELKNAHIMRLLRKVGCVPYDINLKTDTLWFRKEL